MDLRTRLAEDLKSAMREKDTVRTETIRGVRAAILNREVEQGGELDDAAIQQVIVGLVKQRADSIDQYAQGGRQDLVDREQREKELLEGYLPAAPDPAEIEATVQAVITELGASGMKEMGRVMQACKARLGPVVDGKTLSGVVKAALSS
ncbi:MAG: GatB/YqeY domain-containing protein [Myxococcales bacterium]|nr:GatB/YqeY domain-containing protein [Myxococcales bacterium]MDD9969818.1 GatB/YqeY domain-containing protein [Myxococcales bacterium]